MIRATCIVFCLSIGLVNCKTLFGNRVTGDQLVYVKYLEAESPTPADLLLHFKYDGRPKVSWISAVECLEHSDSSGAYNVVTIAGGTGIGQTYIEFSLEQLDATYHRCQCDYYGFYND